MKDSAFCPLLLHFLLYFWEKNTGIENIFKNTEEINKKSCWFLLLRNLSREKCPFRSSHRRCSGKKNVLKNFANSTGKHCVGVSFDRSSHWRFLIKFVKNFVKKDSSTGVFLWSLRNVKEHLFWRTSVNDCFLPLIYFLRAASFVKLCCIALG